MMLFAGSESECAGVRPGEFLRSVAEQTAERRIRFQNLAIELADPDANGGFFEHGSQAAITVVIVSSRKLSQHIHKTMSVSGLRRKCVTLDSLLGFHCGKCVCAFPLMNRPEPD